MKWLIIAVAVVLAGCGFTPQGDLVRNAISEQGAQAFDAGLVNAEFFFCRATSVGSIKRRYGRSAETADAYNALCDEAGSALILGPDRPDARTTGPAE